jgi:hypothetical protein
MKYTPDYAAAQALALLDPDPNAAAHRRHLLLAFDMGCAIWQCARPHRSNGFCDMHHKRHLASVRRAERLQTRYPERSA